MTSDPPGAADDEERLLRAVERVAAPMELAGMPPMAARVFAYALAEDADRYTAAQFAAGLRVSPAAVSGAVRYLTSARLLFRERAPGVRGDVFRVHDDDVWRRILLANIPLVEAWEHAVGDAIGMVGADRPGGRRLTETQEFFAFLRAELVTMVDRWSEHRRTLHPGPPR